MPKIGYFFAILALYAACLIIGGCGETESTETPPPRSAEQPTTIRDSVSEDIRKGQQSTLPGQ